MKNKTGAQIFKEAMDKRQPLQTVVGANIGIMNNKLTSKQITKDVEIINNNQGQWAAAKIKGGNILNSNSWVTKPVATKRAKLLQLDINDGYRKA